MKTRKKNKKKKQEKKKNKKKKNQEKLSSFSLELTGHKLSAVFCEGASTPLFWSFVFPQLAAKLRGVLVSL